MTIDDFIADKIRNRFNLPADAPVEFYINEYGTGIWVGYPEFERDYDSWDEFVADMEKTNAIHPGN